MLCIFLFLDFLSEFTRSSQYGDQSEILLKLRARFFKKTQEWILLRLKSLKESESGFYVSLLNRSIQDLLDYGTSKEPKNPLPEWIFRFFDPPWSERSWIDLFSRETHNPFSDSFGFKNPILDFLKETGPQYVSQWSIPKGNTKR